MFIGNKNTDCSFSGSQFDINMTTPCYIEMFNGNENNGSSFHGLQFA